MPPTNYDGDPTATQAPSDPPGVVNTLTVALPADGDPRNAATFAQPFKVLADWTAFMKGPFPDSTQWARQTWGVFRAIGDRAWYLNHMGHPAGRIIHWVEDWPVGNQGQIDTGGPTAMDTTRRGWSATCLRASGGIARALTRDPSVGGVPSSKLSYVVELSVASTVGDFSHVQKSADRIFSTVNAISLDFDVYVGATGVSTHQFYLGLGNGKPTSALVGGIFYSDGSANWKAVCGNGSALSTAVDTGIAVGDAFMRVEWWGSSVSDDAANAMRFYINDVLVATIVTSLPTAGYANVVFGAVKLSGTTQLTAFIGPARYTASI
jgi:hypothetical protein